MKGQGTPGSRVRKINDKRLRKRICYTGDFKKAGLRGFWKKKKEGKTLSNVVRNEAVLSTIPGEIRRGRGYKISPWQGGGDVNTPSRSEIHELRGWRSVFGGVARSGFVWAMLTFFGELQTIGKARGIS